MEEKEEWSDIEVPNEEQKEVEYEIEEQLELEQRYSIPFIQMMCAFNKLSTEFVMRFDSDRPMDGKYILGENSYICFFVAPKMDDD